MSLTLYEPSPRDTATGSYVEPPKVASITIRTKIAYGRPIHYPRCENAKLFTKLIGRPTLTKTDIETIEALGFKVVPE